MLASFIFVLIFFLLFWNNKQEKLLADKPTVFSLKIFFRRKFDTFSFLSLFLHHFLSYFLSTQISPNVSLFPPLSRTLSSSLPFLSTSLSFFLSLSRDWKKVCAAQQWVLKAWKLSWQVRVSRLNVVGKTTTTTTSSSFSSQLMRTRFLSFF